MVEEPRNEIDDRYERRPPHRRSRCDHLGISTEHDESNQRRAPSGDSSNAQCNKNHGRQDGHVAPRNRDDVIRAGRLQSRTHFVRQSAAVTNQYGRHDCRGQGAVGRDPPGDAVPDLGAQTGRDLAERGTDTEDVDQQGALD